MFEFGLGVVLAVLFVAAYLLIAAFFRKDRNELGGMHPSVTLSPVDSTHSIGAGKARRVLSSGEAGNGKTNGETFSNREEKKHRS